MGRGIPLFWQQTLQFHGPINLENEVFVKWVFMRNSMDACVWCNVLSPGMLYGPGILSISIKNSRVVGFNLAGLDTGLANLVEEVF